MIVKNNSTISPKIWNFAIFKRRKEIINIHSGIQYHIVYDYLNYIDATNKGQYRRERCQFSKLYDGEWYMILRSDDNKINICADQIIVNKKPIGNYSHNIFVSIMSNDEENFESDDFWNLRI